MMNEIKNNFLENLQDKLEKEKITQVNLSNLYIKLAKLNNQINEKESNMIESKIKNEQKLNHQSAYVSVMEEYKSYLKKQKLRETIGGSK